MKNLITLLVVLLFWNMTSPGQTVLISPSGDGGFETGNTLALNNWTAVMNQIGNIDTWFVGSVPVVSAGINCGYVTANAGVSWTYSEFGYPGSQSIIHLYHNVTLPAGESTVLISFKWKAQGEGTTANDGDNMKVFFTPSTVNPQGSSAISSIYQVGATTYNLSSSSWNSVNNITVSGTPGSTYKLIFSWYSNSSTIVNPPAALDEISLTSYTPVAANAAPINFSATAVTGTSMNIGWTDNSTNETGFRLYRSTDNINFTQVGADIVSSTTGTTGTAYNQAQSGLVPGTTYYFRIAAYFGLESAYLTGDQSTNASTLSGTRSIGGGGSPDYASIAAAIADLNTMGVAPGGITFNVAPGHSETFASPTAGHIITTTGALDRPIVFRKNGEGTNPVITAAAGTGTNDAIIVITGCDYVTFNGIDLLENPANLTPTTQMEWGYAILKSTGTAVDGSQYNTIRNCSITLNKTNPSCTGIYSNNHPISDATLQFTVNAASGTNSFLKIFSNTIYAYNGISLSGYNDPNGTFYDQYNEIGKDGGNQVTNLGGGTSSAGAYGINAQCQNYQKVANNIITSTTGGNALSASGINLSNGKNSSYDVYNNTVSIQFSGPGSASFYGIYSEMSSLGTSNIVNVYNNTVTGCTFPTMVNGTVRYINLNNLGVTANVYGNTVSNNDVGDGVLPTTGAIHHIVATKSSYIYGLLNVYNNIVSGNQRKTSSPGISPITYIWASGTGSQLNLYGNSVMDNVVRATSNVTIISSSFSGGNVSIHDNIVSGFSEANGTCYGISLSNASSNIKAEVYNNTVKNIEGTTSTTKIQGIYHAVSGSGSYTTLRNNRISDLRAPAASGTTGDFLVGIYNQSAFSIGVYNNSIYLNGASSAANFSSSAFYSLSSSTATIDVRNNIFVNTSTPAGTGVTTAFRFVNTSWNNGFSSLSNNNNLYAGTPGLYNVLFFDGTNKDQTLSAYQARMYPRESQSVSEMPPFVNTSSGSTDLHLLNSVATQCESGGSIIAGLYPVTSDCDNEPRFPNTGYPVGSGTPYAPDQGADEFGGISNDLTAPIINFTPLAPTNSTGERILLATITDGKGVPVSGAGLPMLFWKVNSGSYTGVQGVYISGITYSFAFGSGVNPGDVVSYYIVAQDINPTPNVSAKPFVGATGYSANPPACATPPTTPVSYTIVGTFSGTFHVGVGKDYETLTLAAAAINTNTLTGPVVLILDDAAYPSETYPVTFNSNPGSSLANAITIVPNTGVSPVFNSTSSTTGIIDLNGIDFLTIDGSNNGTNSRDLTISNSKTGTNGTYAIAFRSSGTGNIDPATNITVKNCILKAVRVETGGSNTTPVRFISPGGGYQNIVIDNNLINSGFNGIQLWGSQNTGIIRNVQISNNIIGSANPSEAIVKYGIDMIYADNTLILNNEIMGPSDGTANKPLAGIQVGSVTTNSKIRKNKIHTWIHPADDGGGCFGIYCATDATTVTEISNNLIYDLQNGGNGPTVASTNTYGILFNYGGNTKIWNNTINLSGPYLSVTKNASSACLGFMSTVIGSNFDIRNNILRNGMTPIGGGILTSGRANGIMFSCNLSEFSGLDHNDYWIDGYSGNVAQHLPNQGSTPIASLQTLSSWQAYSSKEVNSVNIDPVFTSAVNFVPTTTLMNNAGDYIPEVDKDITGAPRSNPPDVGAYEFAPDQVVITDAAVAISGNSATLNGHINASGYVVNVFFDYGLTSEYGTTVAGTPVQVTGSTLVAVEAAISGLDLSTTYHFRARGVTTTGLTVYGNDLTFTTLANTTRTVNLSSIFLEGLYDGAGTMRKAQDEAGDHFPGSTVDQITVELRDGTVYGTLIYTADNINLSTTGTATFTVPGTHNGNYYLTIMHRNSITTVSAVPVSFAGSVINYAFDAPSQAYGNNMMMADTHYLIYGGDENMDGLVDSSDMIDTDNDVAAFATGYLATDVNGDGLVDSSDMILIDNNASAFISSITP